MNQADTAWMLISTALVLLMTPALAFFYGGLVRSKNALNTMMMSVASLGVVGIVWALVAYTIAFADGSAWVGGLQHAGDERAGGAHLLDLCGCAELDHGFVPSRPAPAGSAEAILAGPHDRVRCHAVTRHQHRSPAYPKGARDVDGRPVGHDSTLYKDRNTVERAKNLVRARRGVGRRGPEASAAAPSAAPASTPRDLEHLRPQVGRARVVVGDAPGDVREGVGDGLQALIHQRARQAGVLPRHRDRAGARGRRGQRQPLRRSGRGHGRLFELVPTRARDARRGHADRQGQAHRQGGFGSRRLRREVRGHEGREPRVVRQPALAVADADTVADDRARDPVAGGCSRST